MSPDPDRRWNVLFLCTGNSARSILAEALINHHGGASCRGYSAGSRPRGEVHPMALELLRREGLPTDGLRSKSWDEFAGPAAPPFDFIFTVCDQAAGEVCPVWPGQPMTAHWGIADPAAVAVDTTQQRRAFREAFRNLEVRIRHFLSLPLATLEPASLRRRLDQIGHSP